MKDYKNNAMNPEQRETDVAVREMARFLEELSDSEFTRMFRTPIFTEQVLNAASVSPTISARLDDLMRSSFSELPAADQALMNEAAERVQKRLSSKTKRHPSSDEALRFLAGVLPETDHAEIKRHVESGCAECRPLFGVNWLRKNARALVLEGARLLRAPLNIPAPILGFTAKDEPQELYRELIHAADLVVVVEQDRDEILVRIRAADGKTMFRSVYIAVLSPAGSLEAQVPWEAEHFWPAQHRFPDFNRVARFEGSVSLVVSPIPEGGELPAEGDK